MNRLRLFALHADVSPSIDDALQRTMRTQAFCGSIHCEAFGDATEIDTERAVKYNMIAGQEFYITPRTMSLISDAGRMRQQFPLHQFRANRDVEITVCAGGNADSLSQNFIGAGVHLDRRADIGPVEPTEVTIWVMKAHEAMNSRDLSERSVYRPMRGVRSHTLNADAHQRSEPGLGAFNDLGLIV
jgi:hypothetical protein